MLVPIMDIFKFLPEMPLVRYMADITPTEKAMLPDRNWPLVSLLVFTCAAAAQPKSFVADKEDREGGRCMRSQKLLQNSGEQRNEIFHS